MTYILPSLRSIFQPTTNNRREMDESEEVAWSAVERKYIKNSDGKWRTN
jgi:cation transport regulator ChaB